MINEKKAIEEIKLMDFTTISNDGIEYVRKDMLVKLINNQPQVQPIVRSAEEIEKIVEAIYINMDCDDCPNRKKCSKIGANISCKDYWTAYLTWKEV